MVSSRHVSSCALGCAFLLVGCYDGVGDAVLASGEDGGTGASSGVSEGSAEGGDTDGEDAVEVEVEPLHRLNQLEYNNTVRDLLGTTLRPADAFPPDNVTNGFDNVAIGLTLTPSLMDLYASAARDVAADALRVRPRYAIEIGARDHATLTGQAGNAFDFGWSLSRGDEGLSFTVELAQAEDVTYSILAGGDAVGRPTPIMGLEIDGVELTRWTVTSLPSTPAVYSAAGPLAAGAHTVRITFPNGDDQPAENVFNSLVVGYLELESAQLFTPPGRAMVFVCEPSQQLQPRDCYHEIVTRFAERAWRRPLTSEESAGVVALWEQLAVKENGDDAVMLVVRALLMSSKFLYRASFIAPTEDMDEDTDLVPLDDHVLASRLSYFLWSSMPDDELLAAAADGELRDDDGMRAQVRRMLADPKADGLRQGFASQWLSTRMFARHAPDPTMFPSFDTPLRTAMIAEAELFFADFVRNGRPLGDMMTAEFGYLNDRLAAHYGVAAPGSAELIKVEIPQDGRRGLLTQGAWLTATSASTRTSPVNRGRWILDQLLCNPVPPPPPDIPPLEPPQPGETVRETLAKHRENVACAGCHDLIDPAGLGMEGFDPVGVARTHENGVPIDVSGALPDNQPFDGVEELAAIMQGEPRFVSCVTDKLYGYALGREVVAQDDAILDRIEDGLVAEGGSLDRLIELIAVSPAFRMRPREVE
ncbi:MAG: DUF1592 domain-containing protein [Deltaproteobacteria bacterium]|nr:DUF1592 domain-containing protein [Nannocystaceae bacterium]